MISKILLLPILLIILSTEQTQLPNIYAFYVCNETSVDLDEGPSKLISGDETQTIALFLKKDFSFILTDRNTTLFSVYTEKIIGTWHLTSSNDLQLNIRSTENTFNLEGLDEAYKESADSSYTLTLHFSQSLLIYDDKKLIPSGKLIKFNKKQMKKLYGNE